MLEIESHCGYESPGMTLVSYMAASGKRRVQMVTCIMIIDVEDGGG